MRQSQLAPYSRAHSEQVSNGPTRSIDVRIFIFFSAPRSLSSSTGFDELNMPIGNIVGTNVCVRQPCAGPMRAMVMYFGDLEMDALQSI